MVEKLQAAGVEVYRAVTLIEVDGVPYQAGTYVIPMRQSLRGSRTPGSGRAPTSLT